MPSPGEAAAAALVHRQESCSLSAARRVAALLDRDPEALSGEQYLPRGWHFFLLAGDTRRSALRADGFPGLGVPMPDLGLPRLMLGGRTVNVLQDLPLGASLARQSQVQAVQHKTTANGPMALVTLAHALTLHGAAEPALLETQTYVLLPASPASASPAPAGGPLPPAPHRHTMVPDDTLLFQYSALGFNSHRIHLDRQHAQQVEGFPDLVVNGGLVTLLLTEFLQRQVGVTPQSWRVRHLAPLYANRPLTLSALPDGAHWTLQAHDDQQRLAVDMKVTV